MNTYVFEIDLVKISLIFLISFAIFSLFIFRSFTYQNKLIYPLVFILFLSFLNAYVFIFEKIHYPNLIPSLSLLLGPLLLSFIKNSLREREYLLRKESYHFIPSILLVVIAILNISVSTQINFYKIVFIVAHFGIYLLIAINKLIAKKVVVLRQAETNNCSSSKWASLFNLLLTISFVYITALIEIFVSQTNVKFRFVVIAMVFACLFLLARNFILKTVRAFSVYKEKKDILKIEKYKDSVLTKEEGKEIAGRLEELMLSRKIYLEESINLKSLSIELKTHPKKVSQVINENFNKNFFDYVNSYRIEDTKKMLADKAYIDYKIYEIMFEVGFNSRSSFNTAFKKNTGITAKQYRERNLYK